MSNFAPIPAGNNGLESVHAKAQPVPPGLMSPVKSQTRQDDNELINILVVDDEPKNLTVLETILDDARYRLVRAESADQALLALVVEDFALLILDIRMPGMTGFELAQMIKERKKTARVPIIFLTAYYNEDQHILEGYGNGAVDYLHKPVNAAILRSKVAVFAELHIKNRELTMVNRALLAEVSERRRAEDQLRELNETLEQRVAQRTSSLQQSEFNYRSLFEGAGVGNAEADLATTCFSKVNRRFCELVGYSQEELIGGMTYFEITYPDDRQALVAATGPFATGEIDVIESDHRFVRKGGEIIWVSLTCTGIRDATGKIDRVLLAVHDITARKRGEDEVKASRQLAEQAKAAAETANKAKDQFLAVLSHELRTPLTPVLTTVEMMEVTGAFGDDDLESLKMIRRNIGLEVRLIDDLLDLSRINQGKVKLHMTAVDLHEVLRQVIEICDSDIRSKALKLNLELNAERHYVRGDAARLQQILWNLLKNAVKFTPVAGAITLRAENHRSGRVRISVSDTGVGIQPENLPLVFDAFEQGEYAREFGGLGLGLAISRHMAELHGGTLTVQSDGRDRGATFTLELGVETRDHGLNAAPRAVDSHTPGQRRRILLVEDHADSRSAISRTLKHWGYDFRIAENVAAALKLADAETFDLVVSDIGLPDGSGLDLMRQLLAKRPVKGIALSGYGMEEDVRRSRDAGFTEHLTKPVSLDQLEAAVQRILAT